MIDEKKIEEAAIAHIDKEYSRYNSGEVEEEMICYKGMKSFKSGINWFLESLWHKASEEPKVADGKCCVTCLIKFKNGSVSLCSYFPSLEDKWVCDGMNYKDFLKNFKSWLYIEDLMKESEWIALRDPVFM